MKNLGNPFVAGTYYSEPLKDKRPTEYNPLEITYTTLSTQNILIRNEWYTIIFYRGKPTCKYGENDYNFEYPSIFPNSKEKERSDNEYTCKYDANWIGINVVLS